MLPHKKKKNYGYKNESKSYDLDVSIDPTYELPTLELSVTPTDILFKVGSSINFIVDFIFDRGAINIEETFQDYRAGSLNQITVDGSPYAPADNPVTKVHTILSGSQTINCEAFHSAGPQPQNSIGENVDTPYPSGSIVKSFVVNGVLPIFSVFYSQDTVKDMSMPLEENELLSYGTTETILLLAKEKETFNPESLYKHKFLIPKAWDDLLSGITIMQYNDLTNSYDIPRTDHFVAQAQLEQVSINGISYDFVEYLNTDVVLAGRLDIKLTFNYI